MAYDRVDDPLIQIGEATKKEVFEKLRDNQDSFNTDIEALKQVSTIGIFNVKYQGEINSYNTTELDERTQIFKAPVGATFTSVIVTLLEASTSGSLEIQIDRSTDSGVNWSPLLNTPLTLSGITVGSTTSTVDWVSVASQSFNQNDLIRYRFIGIQVGQGSFHISAYGEVG